MKNLFLVLIFLLFSNAFAEELKELPVTILKDTSVVWSLERINFYFENDLFFNTDSQSHSVEKEPFVGYTSLGMSVRYHHFALDYMLTDFTKQYLLGTGDQKYGSLLFSYMY